jgi:hypothetical protein
MPNKPDENLFREVHRRVQDVRNKARKDRDDAVRQNERTAEDEGKEKGIAGPDISVVPPEDNSQ